MTMGSNPQELQDECDLANAQTMSEETGTARGAVPVDVLRPAKPTRHAAPGLLAVDCGLRTGLALFAEDGRLIWYRSHHLGSRAHLKRAAVRILADLRGLRQLVVEGGGNLAEVWIQAAQSQGVMAHRVQAEHWRAALLLPRQQRSGKQAKIVAGELARSIIEQAGAARPKALWHDTAEAILIGWWAMTSGSRPSNAELVSPAQAGKTTC